jgi:predicted  nucleic acid-binding Zn-ribbon protein
LKTFTPSRTEEEIRAIQDKKNAQDFIYQTNQSLQNLNNSIATAKSQHEKNLALAGSNHKDLLIAFENHKDDLNQKHSDMNKRLGEVERKLVEGLKLCHACLQDFAEEYLTQKDFLNVSGVHSQKLTDIEKDLVKKNDYFNVALNSLKGQFKDQIDSLRKDLTPVIPEIDPVQQKIDERLNTFKVDSDGLVLEIARLKKSSTYMEKKIENLYTQIDRLKAGK